MNTMDTVYQEWFKYLNLVYAKILQPPTFNELEGIPHERSIEDKTSTMHQERE